MGRALRLILYVSIFISWLFMGTGCRPTRMVSDGDYLLQRNALHIDSKDLDKKSFTSYYRQKPNKRTLIFFRFNLAVYNFSQRGKERKWKNWLARVAGEEPIILDSLLVNKTKQQFDRYLVNEAYYKGTVDYTIIRRNKRAWVHYYVSPKEPLVINELSYNIEDSALQPIIYADTLNNYLKPGNYFSLDNLQDERNRLSNAIRDSGYYNFKYDYIHYAVDTQDYKASVVVDVSKNLIQDENKELIKVPHKKYRINNVYLYPDYDPQQILRDKGAYTSTFDTLMYKNYPYIYPGKPNVRPKVIQKTNSVLQGELYSRENVVETIKNLNSLRLFRLNNINFTESSEHDTLLNAHIQLTPFTYQNFSISFETTNTKGNVGIGGAFNYQHKNLFKGAEVFDFRVLGSNQFQGVFNDNTRFNILEVGADMSVDVPAFILPFKMSRFYSKYKPKTKFYSSFNYQVRPDYSRVIYSTRMGYYWQGNKNIYNSINPIDLAFVNVENTSKEGELGFLDTIQGTYLENNYKDYFIAGANYSLILKNKKEKEGVNHSYVRWNFDMAGNLINFFDKYITNRDTVEGGYYTLLGQQYAQYVKSDIDYRFYQYLNRRNQFVYRAFGGVAVPFGNANAIPFVKQYYSGGAEGMRAWQVKDLGPGIYQQPDTVDYPNQMADIKLEFNFEYRFDISNAFKGAFFVDVSNIWAISDDDERPGALFKWDEFYKQFAVGSGLGLRYDVKFVIVRIDAGIKVRDPSIPGTDSWLLFNQPFKFNQINWNFAIGYPF